MGIEGHYKETPIIEATFNFEEKDYTSAASGQLRTRFQAFIESLEIKKIQAQQ